MKEILDNAANYLKSLENINGCLTGSYLLDYFEGQDLDVFVYSERDLTNLLNVLGTNKMFQLIDDIEKWKYSEYLYKGQSSLKKIGIISIKFKYNLSIDVNIIYKKGCENILSVLSSFDFDVVSRGYDLRTKQFLSLSDNNTKEVDWNRWNVAFLEFDLWKSKRILRQIERCIKYHQRGLNTDKVVIKYIEIIDKALSFKNIFKSEDFDNRLFDYKESLKILKELCNEWLKNHTIEEEDLKQLQEIIKKEI